MAETTPDNVPAQYDADRVNVEQEDDHSSCASDAIQAGVKKIEVVSQTWTQSSLIAAYLG